MADDPTAKVVKPPAGTVGVSKLPFTNKLAASALAPDPKSNAARTAQPNFAMTVFKTISPFDELIPLDGRILGKPSLEHHGPKESKRFVWRWKSAAHVLTAA
jgi:hypothetical protein